MLRLDDDGKWYIRRHMGRTNEVRLNFNLETLLNDLMKCKKDIFAVRISTCKHANTMVINNKLKTIEVYDPHGFWTIKEKCVKSITSLVESINAKLGYEVITPTDSCPRIQKFDKRVKHSKACTLWSLWLLELRMKFPSLSSREISKIAGKEMENVENVDKFLEDFTLEILGGSKIKKVSRGVYMINGRRLQTKSFHKVKL